MRRGSIFLLLLLMLTGCTTEYITAPLPAFVPVRPARPMLTEVSEHVPIEAAMNTARLMAYCELLENYADAWEDFYGRLRHETD